MNLEPVESPAVQHIDRMFSIAIESQAEEISFGCYANVNLDVSYMVGGVRYGIDPPPSDLVAVVTERLVAAVSTSPEAGWLRVAREPRWWQKEPLFMDNVPRAGYPRPCFVDLFAVVIPDLAAHSWRLVFDCPVNQAQSAYRRRDYDETFRLLDWLRPRGHPDALVLLAHLYEKGLGTNRDEVVAAELLKRSKYPESQWCLIGNIVKEHSAGPGGADQVEGTKHFKPGAKVHCLAPQWGDGYEKIKVVGRHRKSNRYVTMVIRSSWVTNWRAKVIYSPTVLHRLNWAGIMWKSEISVRQWVQIMGERHGTVLD